MFLKNKISS